MRFVHKWLPIIFGCHCMPERSFAYKGRPFPICARCTGELVGIIFCIFTYFFIHLPAIAYFVMAMPMLVDGFVQMLTRYESTNFRRFVTGFLFGYAFMTFIIWSSGYAMKMGVDFGETLNQKHS